MANKYGKLINMYEEKTAGTKNAFTGKSNPGYGVYIPVSITLGKSSKEAGLTDGFDLHLITQRDVTQTKSRTIVDYWLGEIYPENCIVINKKDAEKYGFKTGDKAKILSATKLEGVWDLKNGVKKEIVGKIFVTGTIQTGVISFTIGHGHWVTGFNANAAMWVDPHLKNTCMLDPVGGSVSFYDTKIKLIRV